MTEVNRLFMEFIEQLEKYEEAYKKGVSEANAIEQDLLHFLENENCDAVTMVIIAKKIQENRRARRNDKVCLQQIQSIKDNKIEKRKNLDEFENKTYTYKSDVMSHISHKPKKVVRCKDKK